MAWRSNPILSETDIVLNSLKFLPVSGAADFRDVLLAKAESPPKAPKPTTLEQFIATHPTKPEKLVHIEPTEAAKMAPDFLFDELAARLCPRPRKVSSNGPKDCAAVLQRISTAPIHAWLVSC